MCITIYVQHLQNIYNAEIDHLSEKIVFQTLLNIVNGHFKSWIILIFNDSIQKLIQWQFVYHT